MLALRSSCSVYNESLLDDVVPPENGGALITAGSGPVTSAQGGRNGSAGNLVVGFDNPALIEFWSWHLVPGEWHDGVAHPAGTREILFVKAGELTLAIGGVTCRAKAGETITFIADKPHRYANDGKKKVEMLMVVCEPGRGGASR